MKEIPLRNREGDTVGYAFVDDDDYEYLSRRRWFLTAGGYAARTSSNGGILMHRLIMKTPDDLTVDHIDRVKLNNQKHNLRNVTQSENNRNRRCWSAVGVPTVRITINISEEQIRRAEALARHRRMTTGESASRSSEIGRAIDALFLIECPTNSTIVPCADRPAEPVAK